MLTQKVEVGFDLTSNGGPFLVLDDPISGQLDNSEWTLGGTLFYDITNDVRSIIINRGKARFLDTYSAGEAIVELDNGNRYYDPTFEDSPFYGQIVPKREVRISSNGIRQYSGVIDDWNLSYNMDGESTATFVASDGFVYLNNQTLPGGTAVVQSSGDRVAAILDDPAVQWPIGLRHIDTGITTLGADVIPADTNVLSYLQLVETTENGRFFINKDGYVTFLDRTVAPSTTGSVELTDNGSGISYNDLNVVYGSEFLANEIVVSSAITTTSTMAIDLDSQNAYGIFNLTLSDLLMNTDAQAEDLAIYLAAKYSQPQYRFDSITVLIDDLTLEQQNQMLGIELGDVVKVSFTPNGISPAIVKYGEVISCNHDIGLETHAITLGLSTLEFAPMVLDDPEFGKIESGYALGF